MTIYRKVKVADRLPETHDGVFFFSDGYINVGSYRKSKDAFVSYTGMIYGLKNVDWWLEEITLPDEEDIDREASSHFGGPDWESGANYILNKIKGEK